MRVLDDLEDMLHESLKEITKKGDLQATALESADKIVDILKDIDEIRCHESDDGYSRMHGWSVMPTYGYGNRGSYTAPYTRNYGRYSRNGIADKLAMIMDEATTDQERNVIQKCMNELGY